MDDKGSDFCSIHVYLQPPDPWEGEKISLAYEGFQVLLLVSLMVITKSLQRVVMFSMVLRHILDHIQKKNIYHI